MRPLKIMTIGEGMVGKTSMLVSYTYNQFPKEYVPTVFDSHACNICIDGSEYALTLWESHDDCDIERTPIAKPNTDCFLLCYSISRRSSFENVWYNLRYINDLIYNQAPIVLVGTMSDLRKPDLEKYVSTEEGEELKREIEAHSFVECSAKLRWNLSQVFSEAVRAAIGLTWPKLPTCTTL